MFDNLDLSETDTLLNVFLAIAVDNLANAQELTAAEEEQAEDEEKVCTVNYDVIKICVLSISYYCWKRKTLQPKIQNPDYVQLL